MNIEQMISGCQALFNTAVDSSFLKTYLLVVFLAFPFLKVTTSTLKTRKKIALLKKDCSSDLPKKLERIVIKHGVDSEKIFVSCKPDLVAMAIGFSDRKIIFSKPLMKKLSSKELEAVFLHELHHLNNHHALILLVGQVISETLFFFPILKDVFISVRSQFEKSADSAAVEYQHTTRFVKKSLVKLLNDNNNFGAYPQFSYQVLNQRLGSLNNERQSFVFSLRRAFLSVLFIVAMGLFVHLNSTYAIASTIEQKIDCSFFECARSCVVDEILTKGGSFNKSPTEPMSPVNFSMP